MFEFGLPESGCSFQEIDHKLRSIDQAEQLVELIFNRSCFTELNISTYIRRMIELKWQPILTISFINPENERKYLVRFKRIDSFSRLVNESLGEDFV